MGASTRRLRVAGLVAVLVASGCSGPDREAPPRETAAAARTPGVCGPWEEADSARRDACLALTIRPITPGRDTLFPGDCGWWEPRNLDSLRTCLRLVDSMAARCPLVGRWSLRHGDGARREAEWRRCGTEGRISADSVIWPLHFLVIRRDSSATSPTIFAHSNSDEPGIGGIDTVTAVDFDGDGTDELFFVDQVYGTGANFDACALTVAEGRFRCWSGPDFTVPPRGFRKGEAGFKGWLLVSGPPDEEDGEGPLVLMTGRSFWYTTPVYRDGDPNCCPSAGASLWLESRPDSGRFAPGVLLRIREDTLGTPLDVDTLRQPDTGFDRGTPARVTLRSVTGPAPRGGPGA